MSDYTRQIFTESGTTPSSRHPQIDQIIYGQTISITVILVIGSLSAVAQDKPSSDMLAAKIALEIPPYWKIGSVEVTASANIGDAVEPMIKQRFEAAVTPTSALYVEDKESRAHFGPFTPIVPTIQAEESRTLYGVATSTYSAGTWITQLKLENSVADLGVPVDLFPTPTVVRGGEQEAEIQERLRPDIAQRVKRQLQAEIETLQAEHESRLRSVAAEHEKARDTRKTQYAAEQREFDVQMDTLKAEHDSRLRTLKAQHDNAVSDLQAQYTAEKRQFEEQRKDLQARQKSALERLRAAHQATRGERKATHARELAALEQTHRSGLAQLKQQHAQQLEKITLVFEQEAEALRADIKHTSALTVLETDKREKEAELAAARQVTLYARTERHQKLLADFRASIASDDLDARCSAFEAAVKGDDPVLRNAARDRGLASGDWELQRLILLDVIERHKVFTIKWCQEETCEKVNQTSALEFTAIDPETGLFEGKLDRQGIRGRVEKPGISWTGYYGTSASLTKAKTLEGTASNYRFRIELF